jgi:hypothetical protein
MSGHHEATTGAIAITLIGRKLPNQNHGSDISIWAKGGFSDERLGNLRSHSSFGTDMGAFLGHRALHQQHREQRRQHHHGEHPKGIEISE